MLIVTYRVLTKVIRFVCERGSKRDRPSGGTCAPYRRRFHTASRLINIKRTDSGRLHYTENLSVT